MKKKKACPRDSIAVEMGEINNVTCWMLRGTGQHRERDVLLFEVGSQRAEGWGECTR